MGDLEAPTSSTWSLMRAAVDWRYNGFCCCYWAQRRSGDGRKRLVMLESVKRREKTGREEEQKRKRGEEERRRRRDEKKTVEMGTRGVECQVPSVSGAAVSFQSSLAVAPLWNGVAAWSSRWRSPAVGAAAGARWARCSKRPQGGSEGRSAGSHVPRAVQCPLSMSTHVARSMIDRWTDHQLHQDPEH